MFFSIGYESISGYLIEALVQPPMPLGMKLDFMNLKFGKEIAIHPERSNFHIVITGYEHF